MAEAARQPVEGERRGGQKAQAQRAPDGAEVSSEALAPIGAETRHARLLADPRMRELGAGGKARLMRQIQRGAGNGYAERVVARAHASAAPPTRRPPAAEPLRPTAAEPEGEREQAAADPAHSAETAPPPADETTVRRWGLDDLSPTKALLRKVSDLARNLPGYSMLGLVLGRDPISGDAVDRSPKNVLRAIMGLIPVVGEQMFLAMDEAGAIDKAFAWADEQFKQLGLSFDLIKETFKKAWDALSITSAITDPIGTWEKLKAIFLGPINKIKSFVGMALEKVKQFIFEAVMEKLGGGPVMGILQKAGSALNEIIKNPIGFIGNLISGIGQGLKQFGANILNHLKKGLFTWLFGEMGAAGIQLPKSFDLAGILQLVLQVLGLTWNFMRGQAAKALGEPIIQKAETGFKIFKIVIEKGIAGLWEFVKEQLSNLKEMVFDAVKDLVVSQVIQAGIQWLIGVLGGPAGAIVKAIKAIYDVVMWFVNNASRIMSLINSIAESLGAIAAGSLGQAAGFIERSLAESIPVLIGFLANLIGLGGLSQKIRGVIEKLQAPVKKAVGFVLDKLKGWAKKFWGKVKGAFGKKEKPEAQSSETEKKARLEAAKTEVQQLMATTGATVQSVESKLPAIKTKYQLQSISLVREKPGTYHVHATINPTLDGPPGVLFTNEEIAELEVVAKEYAVQINKKGDKAVFLADPDTYLKPGSKGQQKVDIGKSVEAVGAPGVEKIATDAGLTVVRNAYIEFVDASGKVIGGKGPEIDFLILGPSGAQELVSAKWKPGRYEPKQDRALLTHFINMPLTVPTITAYVMSNFGSAPVLSKTAGANVRSNLGKMPLGDFRDKYLSKVVVSTITVTSLTPGPDAPQGLQLRVTQPQLLAKVIELTKKYI